jgi:hypothetical protein
MEMRVFGRTGMQLSVLGFGCGAAGPGNASQCLGCLPNGATSSYRSAPSRRAAQCSHRTEPETRFTRCAFRYNDRLHCYPPVRRFLASSSETCLRCEHPATGAPAASTITLSPAAGAGLAVINRSRFQPLMPVRFVHSGVTTAKRSASLPDVPTIAESLPGFEISTWQGIGALKNTPADIVIMLNRIINAALADGEVKARLAQLGSEPGRVDGTAAPVVHCPHVRRSALSFRRSHSDRSAPLRGRWRSAF